VEQALAITLLDGALGTLLGARGVDTRGPLFSAASLLDPLGRRALLQAHLDYARAGARVLTTATFRTSRPSLERAGRGGLFPALARDAVAAAREAARAAAGAGERPALVAGALAPLHDCYRPDLAPGRAAALREHGDHARALAQAGCDLLLVETVCSAVEGLSAVEAAASTGLPVWVAAVATRQRTLLDGTPLRSFFASAAGAGARAALINCTPPDGVDLALAEAAASGLPFGARPHLGAVDPACGWPSFPPLAPADYAARARRWARLGATLLGGCCGTTPAHVAALAEALGSFTSDPPSGSVPPAA
jgi:S-methylmethionine-dependent homocysteine/selenocysteine methylase